MHAAAPLSAPARLAARFRRVLLALWLALAPALLGNIALAEPQRATGTRTSTSAKTARKPAKKPAAKTGKPAPRKKPATRPSARATQSDLDRLQAEIRSTEKHLQLTREQREQKEAELRQAELEIGALKTDVVSVQGEVAQREAHLRGLQEEKARRQQDRDRLVNLIKADLRMAQRQGGQDYYKLLLNQENPQTLARLMKYYGYMQQARAGRVQRLNETLARLEEITREEEASVEKLRALRGNLEQQQSRLASAQAKRSQAIRTLSAQLESADEKLQRLRRDERTLQAVMDRLAREAAEREQRDRERREAERRRQQESSTTPGERPPAESRPLPPEEPRDVALTPYKGHCPLPVAGGLRSRFGDARAGGLRWNGILIGAPAGTPVRAVRPGRVAYADYLRGYGLLLIVDHGRGLMSLYGHNQSLQKKAGDNVAANEVIATVGDSGGNDSDGLYFEIRVRGRPSDPASWCAYQ